MSDDAKKPDDKPANIAPDAVKDPNEKTEGHPGKGPQGGGTQRDETDPGSS
ncbi:hypothetical protein [Methylobacterium gregans]|uniref:Uncharacterized protein n=1 Tax=Methylobacterium gregans TaxID=374424 RepID=A0AA37HJK8_9HYPH|nr:hypothetical protein [Methylobacterium gregans]MBE7244507.1 hypothetical protein [Actinomycetospora chiangmaiensis]MDQ0519728.1 hypothetical protein [Methylobacterium gregans]GJD76887.1 hypothetical protein NBEOAGPD_0088 [Methylobacterium gregans]GLS56146.1 hypothetical protein GCM10007886_43310 [Methylobacterium gregans]